MKQANKQTRGHRDQRESHQPKMRARIRDQLEDKSAIGKRRKEFARSRGDLACIERLRNMTIDEALNTPSGLGCATTEWLMKNRDR